MVSETSTPGIIVTNRLVKSMVGIVLADAVRSEYTDAEFDRRLLSMMTARAADLPPDLEEVRVESRNMLRNGSYKPTGRGKPASEYLLRAAQDPDTFPRVNWPVDVCNFISLKYLMPISVWDVDAAGTNRYVFRLGLSGEEYVFNTAGQIISLADLVVGCAALPDDSGADVPIVNPVKDSMNTKTTPSTTRVAAAVYCPVSVGASGLEAACTEFADWLSRASSTGRVAHCIVDPGEERSC